MLTLGLYPGIYGLAGTLDSLFGVPGFVAFGIPTDAYYEDFQDTAMESWQSGYRRDR